MLKVKLAASFAAMLITASVAKGEMDEVRAKVAALEVVRRYLGVDSTHQLRAMRMEDWEDDLFRLQIKVKGRIAKAAFFFEVTETGYFVLSPDEAVHIISNDGQRAWVVAVQARDGTAYGLNGFANAETEFGMLIRGAGLDVRVEADAEAAALLFYMMVRDPRGQSLVFSSRELKRKAEEFFGARLPDAKADSQTSDWWRGFVKAKLGSQIGLKSIKTSTGFDVFITSIRTEDKSLELVKIGLRVNREGLCEPIGTTRIYRRP